MNVDQLAELAQEVENGDPIDWGMIPIKEEDAYRQMAAQVIDMMRTYSPPDRERVALAAVTKLLVENFVLNYQLMEKNHV
jgi:hypothetical protein